MGARGGAVHAAEFGQLSATVSRRACIAAEERLRISRFCVRFVAGSSDAHCAAVRPMLDSASSEGGAPTTRPPHRPPPPPPAPEPS